METERLFILRVLARKEAENRRCPVREWIVDKSVAGTNGHPDLELLRLERALQQARDRLGWITRLVSDAAVCQAAEDQYADAATAVDAYWATHEAPQKT